MDKEIIFADRDEAFVKMYDEMLNNHLEISENSIVLSTSFDGLFLADKLASKLEAKLDLLFSAPILAPLNNECEIATVSENMDIIMNEPLIDSFGISLDYVYGEAQRTYEEVILSRIYKFRKGATLTYIKEKDVFVIDQGIETGITMNLAIKTCIQKKAKSIFVLTPVIAKDIAELLSESSDALIAVNKISNFVSTDHYYKNFQKITDDEVLAIMDKHISAKTKLT